MGFARTGHAMRLMERIAVAVQQREPALLVGETGTGKTALAQQLASQARHCLLFPSSCPHINEHITASVLTCARTE